MFQEKGEKDVEECRCKDTALFHAAFDFKGVGHAILILDSYFMLSWKDLIILCSFGGHLIFRRMLNIPSSLG